MKEDTLDAGTSPPPEVKPGQHAQTQVSRTTSKYGISYYYPVSYIKSHDALLAKEISFNLVELYHGQISFIIVRLGGFLVNIILMHNVVEAENHI